MRTEDVFDFIFIDPPYASREYESLTSIILERHLLAPDGLMFVKFSSKVDLHLSEEWREVTKRVFGETTFSFHAQSSSGVFS
jgi:16S rRNA G966 N2-methylase RsmD